MGDRTAIAWCDHTQNWWLGCFKVSAGCKFCYADELASTRMRIDVFGHDTSKRRRTGKKVWSQPGKWNREAMPTLGRPARVFTLSMGDFFEDAPGPNQWRREAWQIIHSTMWLDWLILTKRPENIARMLPDRWGDNPWGYWPNVWLGTSIESNDFAGRAAELVQVPALNHFISYEPAIGPGDEIPLKHIEWVIYGGESGQQYNDPALRRDHDITWAFDMWARCEVDGVAFFYKQSPGRRTETGIDALGRVVREYPPSWDRAELRRAA